MKLHDTLGTLFFPNRYIIQFSPIRTGSTLVYNILRELFPGKIIKKAHVYDRLFSRLVIIATIRHPLDCIGSILRINDQKPDTDAIQKAVQAFDASGVAEIVRMRTGPNFTVLKYEEFVHNPAVIFDAIERAFKIKIDDRTRKELAGKYDVDSLARTTAELGSFGNWDPVTKLHGNHISADRGKPGAYNSLFSEEQTAELKAHYRELFEAFGYQ